MSEVEKIKEEDVTVLDAPVFDELSLITVTQLPIIEEQLEQLKNIIDERTKIAVSLEVTEDNRQIVKKLRANLNKEKKELQAQYKQALEKVTAPLEKVQAKFKDCISGYDIADKELKEKIALLEDAQKEIKRLEVTEYFDEYAQSKDIDFLTFEDLGINVTLSSSVASLKKQISAFLERVVADLKMIATQEDEDEILVEYKKSLDASNAITTVKERKKRIEEEKARKEKEAERRARAKAAEQAVVNAVEEQEQISDELPFPEAEEGYIPPEAQAEPLEAPAVQNTDKKLKPYTYTFSFTHYDYSAQESLEKVKAFKPELIKFIESRENFRYGKQ